MARSDPTWLFGKVKVEREILEKYFREKLELPYK